MDNQVFDVAVVGAGPAGSATARRLALRGYRVALIERTRFTELRVGESLAPAVQPLLTELGVWHEFLALNPLPSYGTRSLWGGATPQEHSHLMSPYGCGWHVDRLAFDRMLAAAAVAAGARLFLGTKLCGCEASIDGWQLHLTEDEADTYLKTPLQTTLIRPEILEAQTVRVADSLGKKPSGLRARCVIDATGRSAHLAPWVSARRFVFDRLIAVTTLFRGINVSKEGFILVETSPDGWWYSAPLSEDRMMVMLMTDSDLCGRAKLATASAWSRRLCAASATTTRVTHAAPLWKPRVFSAISQRLYRSEHRAPWLAVGDAALAVDPISGSGVVRALRTAAAGAEAALAVLENGATDAIEAFESDRDQECTAYLQERALYYDLEQRWCLDPFWQRRMSKTSERFHT